MEGRVADPAEHERGRRRPTRSGAEQLAALIERSSSTVALTGAGISVPSGIPDFRTPGEGIWEDVDPFEVASIQAFQRDPKRFWDFYRPRFSMLGDKLPNPAHDGARRARGAAACSTPSSPRTSTASIAPPAPAT